MATMDDIDALDLGEPADPEVSAELATALEIGRGLTEGGRVNP